MTNKEAKNTICAFYEQILKELWLTREARNGLGEALDLAIKALEEEPKGKTNAEIFKQTFGIYATELWSMKEADFLKWLNEEVEE